MAASNLSTDADQRVRHYERHLVERVLDAQGYGMMIAPRELVAEILDLIHTAMEVVPSEMRLKS